MKIDKKLATKKDTKCSTNEDTYKRLQICLISRTGTNEQNLSSSTFRFYYEKFTFNVLRNCSVYNTDIICPTAEMVRDVGLSL